MHMEWVDLVVFPPGVLVNKCSMKTANQEPHSIIIMVCVPLIYRLDRDVQTLRKRKYDEATAKSKAF